MTDYRSFGKSFWQIVLTKMCFLNLSEEDFVPKLANKEQEF